MRNAWVLLLLGLAACGTEAAEETTCDYICRDLVQTCEYAAYPSLESCRQGCEYAATDGADVEGQYDCISDAISEDNTCNTFAIVECEHAFGEMD